MRRRRSVDRTTVVETGNGGGGGGVLAVVLLIIVVLVLLFLFRSQLGLGAIRRTSTFPIRSTSTSRIADPELVERAVASSACARARFHQEPRPFEFAACWARLTGCHDRRALLP